MKTFKIVPLNGTELPCGDKVQAHSIDDAVARSFGDSVSLREGMRILEDEDPSSVYYRDKTPHYGFDVVDGDGDAVAFVMAVSD